MIKVRKEMVRVLARDIEEAIQKRLNDEGMHTAEIQLALTQMIYQVGVAANELEKEKALREKARVAA